MKKKSESGQAIVLLVFAIIGLLGFTALAIDGGMVYADRRHAQSASDAASLAGGGSAALDMENNHIFYNDFDCSDSDITTLRNNSVTVATNRAISNDYSNAEITVTTVCEDNGPLFDEKYIDITTEIVKETNTSLIHFVYDGPATNQVEATVRIRPRNPLAFGHAIVALNEDACSGNSNGVILGGSSQTVVDGGGIFSNGCLKCNGLSTDAVVVTGTISYAGTASGCDAGDLVPNPQQSPEVLPASSYYVPTPDCSSAGAVTIDEIKSSINLNTTYPGKTLICLTSSGNAIKLTNGNLTGLGITLYLVNSGDIEISGGLVTLSAPAAVPDPDPGIAGIMIYVDPGDRSVIKINGNSASSYYGVTYAPNADIEVTGTGDIDDPTVYNTQIIGLNVEVSGNAYIDINFNDEENYSKPTSIDLTQ